MAMPNNFFSDAPTYSSAAREIVRTTQTLLDAPTANWSVIVPSLLIILATAGAFSSMAKPLGELPFRIGRRALVYLIKRTCSIIVDRLLELLIVVFVAMTSASGLVDIATALSKIFH
jgi:hypothetical protein